MPPSFLLPFNSRGLDELPYRHVLLQAVDGVRKEGECFAPMRGQDAQEERGLPYWNPAGAVDEDDCSAGMQDRELAEVLLQDGARHRLVGLVVKALQGTPLLHLADDPAELDCRTDLARGQSFRRGDDGVRGEVNFDVHGAGDQPPETGGMMAISVAVPRG